MSGGCNLICVENVVAAWLAPQLAAFTLDENLIVGEIKSVEKTTDKCMFVEELYAAEPIPKGYGGSCYKQKHISRIRITLRGNKTQSLDTKQCLREVIECTHFAGRIGGLFPLPVPLQDIRAVDGQPFKLPDSPSGHPIFTAAFDVRWAEEEPTP